MFRGNVVRPSHEGGVLISFTGSSPALGTYLETEEGIRLGKVDTVLGSIHKPWVHVYPITKGLDIVDVLGKNTIISSKRNAQKNKPRREERKSKFSRYDRKNEKKIFNDNDWICPKCKNDNFSWRERCNKCSAPKEGSSRFERNKKWNEGNRSERPRRGRNESRSERPRRGRNESRSERPRRGRNENRSERPRRNDGNFENNNRRNYKESKPQESRNRGPKRLRNKSRTHFKNRELDDIFKNKDR